MPDIELATTTHQNTAPTGPTVWILSIGEACEGASIVGVYLDRDLAYGDFVTEAKKIDQSFGICDVKPAEDGSILLTGGCDVLTLEPYAVTTRHELTS